MDEARRLNLITFLNGDEINQACRGHLRAEFLSSAHLHCLSLIRQALDRRPENEDDLEAMLVHLESWNPREAQAWLFDELSGDGVLLCSGQLENASREVAEDLLLDLLRCQLVERR